MWKNYLSDLADNPLYRSLKWNFFSYLFGFVNVAVLGILAIALEKFSFEAQFQNQLNKLILLNFSIGISLSVAVDYFFIKRKMHDDMTLIVSLYAAVVFLFGVVITTLDLLKESSLASAALNIENLRLLQMCGFFISLLYSISVKSLIFSVEKRKKN